VGGVTPSSPAKAPIVRDPPNTRTDNAERRGAERPVARSSCASRRRRWSAAEWTRAASSSSGTTGRAMSVY
jgi:hypothetical protein